MSSCSMCKSSMNVKADLCTCCGARMLQRLEKQQARATKKLEIAALNIEDYNIEWIEELDETVNEDLNILEQALDAKLEKFYEQRQTKRNSLIEHWRTNIKLKANGIIAEESIRKKARLEHELLRLNSINLLNEVFHIWYTGSFGTINGLRLGRTLEVQVPWSEINAACGQCVLLLDAFLTNHKLILSKYRLIPMGSNSRIIELSSHRKNHLLHYDHPDNVTNWSKIITKKKNFDAAMITLVACLAEIAHLVGVSNQLPFKLGNGTIGDLSIKLDGSEEVTWTRACKYLLANLKWLIGTEMLM